MGPLHTVLVLLHTIVMAVLIAAPLVYRGAASALLTWAARLQLLLGLALVGINEGMGAELNHAKVGVKLLVAVAVVACCEIAWAKRKRGESSPLPWVALVLTLVNTAVAYFWT